MKYAIDHDYERETKVHDYHKIKSTRNTKGGNTNALNDEAKNKKSKRDKLIDPNDA